MNGTFNRRQGRRTGRKVQRMANAGAAREPARGVEEGRRKNAECRMKALRAATGGATRGHRRMRYGRNDEERTKSDQVNRIKSDQIKSNPTQKNGQARIKARAVGSKLARTNLDVGRARCMQANAKRVNGNANCLGDRNTFFICFTGERGLGLAENLRLSSLILSYSRVSSLNGRK